MKVRWTCCGGCCVVPVAVDVEVEVLEVLG
jgi:hypothetical protein